MSILKDSRSFAGSMFLLLLILASRSRAAEQPFPFFSHLRVESGLSHDKVNCILQDKRGFIWLGTEDGLNRYDGKYDEVFTSSPGDTTCISGNIITAMLEDEDGVLWVATADGGLTQYDYRLAPAKQFRQFRHRDNDPRSIPTNDIVRLLEDDRGYLWMATGDHSILRFDRKTGRFDVPVRQRPYNITSLCLNREGILWAGTAGEGVLEINTRTLRYATDSKLSLLPPASVTGIFEDSGSNVWYGLPDRSLHRQDRATGGETVWGSEEDEIVCFAEDRLDKIWMAGRNSGIHLYDKRTDQFYHFRRNPLQEGSLVDDHVNCIYIDRAGIVWVGTNRGVSYYNPLFAPFVQTFLPSSTNNIEIYDFYADEQTHSLWIATSDGLFIKKDTGSELFERRVLNYHGVSVLPTKFFADAGGTFYLGTDYSLFVYDRQKNSLSLLPNTEKDPVMKRLVHSRVVAITREGVGIHAVLAVASYGNPICYYAFAEKKWGHGSNSPLAGRSGNRQLWAFTTRQGAQGWQAARKYIPAGQLFDVREDKSGNLWISTYGSGLNFFDVNAKSFLHIKSSSDLTEGIETDRRGNIWMVCNGHLHEYDPSTRVYWCYDLPGAKQDGIRGYIYKDGKGDLYVAGTNYYIRFRPQTVAAINMKPQVWLTNFKLYNHSHSELLQDTVIRLHYDQNYFSVEFSAPEFSGDNIDYSYMLEGADREWVESGKRNYVNYSDLRPGEYIFKVKATNWRGCDSDRISMIRILIVPPFWKTWWFYLLTIFCGAAICYGIYRYRIREMFKRQAIRNRIALDLHDNIGATLSSISIYSQVARVYQEKGEGAELREVLERIDKTASEAINEMSDMVWAINPRNDHMSSIVDRMQYYAEPLCAAKGIHFDFVCDPEIGRLSPGMTERKNLYFIYKEAVNNALKYSGCTSVEVDFILENNILRLSVRDNGKGFDIRGLQDGVQRTLSGNGMYNMYRRAGEIKAALSVDSHPGQGTRIELSFRISGEGKTTYKNS
jgi:ligand-binding sensor domain-containing protein/two-component sensor histidine kinase